MGYWFYKAKDLNWVREQEVGVGKALRFANFSSCIGVVAEVGQDLWGAHLCLFGGARNRPDGEATNAELFSANDATYLRQLFPARLDKVHLFGYLETWSPGEGPLEAAYQKLETVFQDSGGEIDVVREHVDESGSWSWAGGGQHDFATGVRNNNISTAYGERLFTSHEPRTAVISHA